MNNITILNLKKEKSKYKVITTEGEFVFTEDVIIKYHIFTDKVFSQSEFEEILKKDMQTRLFNKCLKFLSYQSRSLYEINNYLIDNQASIEDIEAIINKLEKLGYINDHKFADEVLDYQIRNSKGPKVVEEKLKQKGIDEKLIQETLSKYDYYTEKEIITKVTNSLINKYKDRPIRNQKLTVYQKLIRDGFSLELVRSLIESLNYIDESEPLLEKEIKKLVLKYNHLSDYELKNKIISRLLNKGYEYTQILDKFNIHE